MEVSKELPKSAYHGLLSSLGIPDAWGSERPPSAVIGFLSALLPKMSLHSSDGDNQRAATLAELAGPQPSKEALDYLSRGRGAEAMGDSGISLDRKPDAHKPDARGRSGGILR